MGASTRRAFVVATAAAIRVCGGAQAASTPAALGLAAGGFVSRRGWAASADDPGELAGGELEVVVPFAAGGSLDALARAVAGPLAAALQRAVIVRNVAGAGGALGAHRVLQRPADGRSLLVGTLADLVLADRENPSIRLGVDDFIALGQLSTVDYVLVAGPTVEATNVDRLVGLARSTPRPLSLAHPGERTRQYLTARQIEQQAGIRFLLVPYSGSAPMLLDLAAGQVDLAIVAVTAAKPQVASGRLKVVALLRPERDPALPAWPVSGESVALAGVHARSSAYLLAPSRVPAPRAERLRRALAACLREPALRQAITDLGTTPAAPGLNDDPARLARAMRDEAAHLLRLRHAASGQGRGS